MSDNVNNNDANNDGNNGGTNGDNTNIDTSDKNWRALESDRNAQKARAEKLMKATVNTIAESAGVNPNEGIGTLIVEKYVGSLSAEDVPDKAAFVKFLEENKYQGAVTPPPGNTGGGNNSPDNATLLDGYQQVGDQLRNNSGQPNPPDVNNLIADAEKAGNHELATSLKFNAQIASDPRVS